MSTVLNLLVFVSRSKKQVVEIFRRAIKYCSETDENHVRLLNCKHVVNHNALRFIHFSQFFFRLPTF